MTLDLSNIEDDSSLGRTPVAGDSTIELANLRDQTGES